MIKEIICKLFDKWPLHANEATEIKKKALNKAKQNNLKRAETIIATDISDEVYNAAKKGKNKCEVTVMEDEDICYAINLKLMNIYGYFVDYSYNINYGKFEISWR